MDILWNYDMFILGFKNQVIRNYGMVYFHEL